MQPEWNLTRMQNRMYQSVKIENEFRNENHSSHSFSKLDEQNLAGKQNEAESSRMQQNETSQAGTEVKIKQKKSKFWELEKFIMPK